MWLFVRGDRIVDMRFLPALNGCVGLAIGRDLMEGKRTVNGRCGNND